MCYHLCNSKTPYRPLFIIHIDSWVYLTQLSSKSSREDMCLLSTSFLLNIQSGVKQKVDMPQIQNCVSQYSSPYWCSVPKYQEAGLCGSWEKCDRNYLVSKFAYVHNIQSGVKQEVDMPQIQNCVTQYSSPYWCSVPNIRKLACVVPENNVTEIFCDADADDDARWWIVIHIYVASAKAGRRHKNRLSSF